MSKTYFFISDIHLGLFHQRQERVREKLLVDFLQFSVTEADELYILGDLFDYWFEYGRVIQKDFYRTLTSLSGLVESGVKVHYIIGNHDFMHRGFFKNNLGVDVYFDPISVELEGKKFFLGHGDGMVNNDLGYRILKKFLRNRFLQFMFSMIHPDLGIWIASSTSKTSRKYTSNKHYGIIDGLFETAKYKIDEGYDFVLFGHSHERALKSYKNGKYINLGTWLDKPCYGRFSGNEFEIVDWK